MSNLLNKENIYRMNKINENILYFKLRGNCYEGF